MPRNYPVVPRDPVVDHYFDTAVEDPYRYLENKADQRTRDAVAAENAYTAAWFAARQDFSAAETEKRLRAEPEPDQISGIHESDGVRCASRSIAGGRHDTVLLNDDYTVRETLLDDAAMGNRMHVYGAEPCPGHPGIFAIRGVIHGAPRGCYVVYDLPNRRALAELDGLFAGTWSPDGRYVIYSDAEVDQAHNRNINRVRRYDWQADKLETLYTHTENAVMIDAQPGPDGWLLLAVLVDYSHTLMLSLAPDGTVTRLNGGEGQYTYLGERNGQCYLMTDDGAPRGKVVALPVAAIGHEGALLHETTTVIPEGEDTLTAAGLIAGGYLTVREQHAVSRLIRVDSSGVSREIPLPDSYGSLACGETLRPSDEGHIFFTFSSFTLDNATLVYDEREDAVRTVGQAQQSAEDIAVERQFVTARDGERILYYLVRGKNAVKDGRTPAMMYGYGGYASSNTPWPVNMVTGHRITEWVRRGRVYVHCILRGGSEYGEAWHQAGMKDTKKNCFYDFIDIAKALVKDGWTTPERIVATGVSNGGLLMTAITTIAPECFGTVIASVPHTDMLRFRQDDRGMMYVTEYGDPLESPEMFAYMRSYSPYHNIHAGCVYPRLYVQTGELDNNVLCYHGEKFAIRMQAEASEEHVVLLEVLPHGSHNRGVGDEYWRNVAQIQTFMEIGLAEAEQKA